MATHSSILAWWTPWTEEGAWQATVYGVSRVWPEWATHPFHFFQAVFYTSMKIKSRSDVSNSAVSDSLQPQLELVEWVAFPFSRGSSKPRGGTQVSHIAGRFFTNWATREFQENWSGYTLCIELWNIHNIFWSCRFLDVCRTYCQNTIVSRHHS